MANEKSGAVSRWAVIEADREASEWSPSEVLRLAKRAKLLDGKAIERMVELPADGDLRPIMRRYGLPEFLDQYQIDTDGFPEEVRSNPLVEAVRYAGFEAGIPPSMLAPIVRKVCSVLMEQEVSK